MRKLLNLPVIILLMLAAFLPLTSIAAGAPTYTVPLQQEEPDNNEQDPNRHGMRVPPKPIILAITPQGIESTIPKSDIINYELWDSADMYRLRT